MGIYSSPTLPVELWREVLLHVCSIPDEFDISSTANGETTYYRHQIYLHNWRKAMKQRLQIALISKFLYAIATEFLYASFIIQSHSDYAKVVEIVRRPETARQLRRITIHRRLACLNLEDFRHCKRLSVYVHVAECRSNPVEWSCPHVMGPNLTYLEICNVKTYPWSQSWKNILEMLPECRCLRALRLTEFIESKIHYPLSGHLYTLPQLELLELTRTTDCHAEPLLFTQWLPSLILPKLNTLLLNAGDLYGPALMAYGNTICTLRINKFHPPTPSKIFPLPKLRRLISAYSFVDAVRWEWLPATIQMDTLEVFEVNLERAIAKLEVFFPEIWSPWMHTDLSGLLGLLSDPSVTPCLKEVDFDLSLRTYGVAGGGLQKTLTRWNKEMLRQRPEVKLRTQFWEEGTEWTSMSLDCLLKHNTTPLPPPALPEAL